MRFQALFTAAVLCAAMVLPASAADTPQQNAMKSCAATWKGMAAADKAKTTYKDYMSSCMKAPAPAATAAAAPAPAMTAKPMAKMDSMKMSAPAGGGQAKCKDGKVVTYKNRSGTCSGHGGVATWM